MPSIIEAFLRQMLAESNGEKIHVRMEMPFDWGVTLSGEIDGKDISVSHEFEFAKYAKEFKKNHPDEKYNIIDFSLEKDGEYSEKSRFDAEFQKDQDAL